ncbi:Transcription termination protein NusB [hydrothermal vent metagenome]|uniref:Transcription termination protein NusB n=1 Tax=hydrothermal vent metagenome TaxID=652676 RepID=A0A3B1D237_9ZZZZ
MGKRRFSRELALKFLYQLEFNETGLKDQMSSFEDRLSCQEEVKEFMVELVDKVVDNMKEIDLTLKKYSEHWALDRMTVIDRNILRLGVCELTYSQTIPPKVVINEAVEIAKKYGSEESPDFINGILDKIYKEMNRGTVQSPTG